MTTRSVGQFPSNWPLAPRRSPRASTVYVFGLIAIAQVVVAISLAFDCPERAAATLVSACFWAFFAFLARASSARAPIDPVDSLVDELGRMPPETSDELVSYLTTPLCDAAHALVEALLSAALRSRD